MSKKELARADKRETAQLIPVGPEPQLPVEVDSLDDRQLEAYYAEQSRRPGTWSRPNPALIVAQDERNRRHRIARAREDLELEETRAKTMAARREAASQKISAQNIEQACGDGHLEPHSI